MPMGPAASKKMAALVGLVVASASFEACADDASAGVPLPPLRITPAGALRVVQAGLQMDGRHVRLELTLAQRSATQTATILWESERVAWMGYGETYPDRHFPELAFQLDGVPVSTRVHDDAWHGTTDLSELVSAAGLDPFSITETPPFVVRRAGAAPAPEPALAAAAHARLIGMGAIETAPEGELAKWTARRRQEVAVPAGVHRLQVTYDARPGIEPATRAALTASATVKRYCVDAAAIPKAAADGGWVIERFSLPAGLERKPPGSVMLAIEARQATPARWFACASDGRPIQATTTPASTAVRADAQGTVHVLRLAPATVE